MTEQYSPLWAVIGPKGEVFLDTIATRRKDSIGLHVTRDNRTEFNPPLDELKKLWTPEQQRGCSARKIQLKVL